MPKKWKIVLKRAEIVECKFLEEFIETPRVDIQVSDLYNIPFNKPPIKEY